MPGRYSCDGVEPHWQAACVSVIIRCAGCQADTLSTNSFSSAGGLKPILDRYAGHGNANIDVTTPKSYGDTSPATIHTADSGKQGGRNSKKRRRDESDDEDEDDDGDDDGEEDGGDHHAQQHDEVRTSYSALHVLY